MDCTRKNDSFVVSYLKYVFFRPPPKKIKKKKRDKKDKKTKNK